MSSSSDKLFSTLDKMPDITEQMEKNKQAFRLRLCQKLSDPGGLCVCLCVCVCVCVCVGEGCKRRSGNKPITKWILWFVNLKKKIPKLNSVYIII